MVQAGSVEALLTLNTSGFDTGISSAVKNIESLVKTLNSISTNAKGFVNGLNQVSKSMTMLNDSFAQFDVSSKKANAFNQIANGMERLVNSARALAEGNMSVQATYQHMENVVNMFAQALSNADIKLKGSISTTRQLAEANSQLSNSHANFNKLSQEFLNIANNVSKTSTNFKGFNISVSQTGTAISQVDTHSKRFIGTLTAGLPQIVSGMHNLTSDFQRFYAQLSLFDAKSNSFKKFQLEATQTSSSINNMTMAMERFNIALASSGSAGLTNWTSGVNNLNTSLRATQMATNLTSTGISNLTTNTNGLNLTLTNMDGSINRSAKSTTELGNGIKNASESTKQFSQGMSSGVNSANRMNTATRGLTGTLNTLRATVGMVASMFLFNFAHNMMISVKNTVSAKSEMLSYLHTMGMTQGQINSFNHALDQTAQRFQRINKYNIGETVANIGLEFDLSAKEMEKAMSVTSMITSEYLRAGRNADEAALAVKDIMQGQFQRLSRETGVKGEDLKKAGWSGDNEDVLGLMDALEKVAKSRHWDVFAEKANSLNDIVLITQNRLSEWATDISEGIVPIITGAFNTLVSVVDNVTGFFQGLSTALNLPDWSGTALLIGGIVTALGGLVLATITTRTHMGLLQIAHQGLTQSILATIFGIKSEEMANMKATTVIKAKILGVKSETMANQGLINILKAKALGLDVETVAQEGVTVAIEKKLMAQRAEELQARKNTANNFSLLSSYVSLKTGIETTDMAGLKWYQKLALLNRKTDEAKVKNMGLRQSLQSFIGSINKANLATKLLTGSIVALGAIALASHVVATINSTRAMKQFSDMVENGDEKIRKMKNTFGENSQEAKNMTEAVEKARSAMGKFEERKYDAQGKMGRTIAGYLDGMVNKEKLRELSDASLRDSAYGVSQLAKLGDEVEQTYRGAANTVGLLKDKVKDLRGEDGLAKFAEDIERNADDIATAQEKLRTSTSPMERGQAWMDLQLGQLGHWWNEFSVNFESHDWGEAWGNIWKGFMNGFGKLPVASDIWGSIFNAVKLEDHIVKGDLLGSLSKMGNDLVNWFLTDGIGNGLKSASNDIWGGIGNHIKDTFVEAFINPFKDIGGILNNIGGNMHEVATGIWNKLTEAFSGLFSGGEGGGGGLLPQKMDTSALLNGLLGMIDINSAGEWFNNNVLLPIQEYISTIDIASLLMASPVDMFGALLNMIFGEGTYEKINAYIQVNILQPLMNLPTAIQGYLTMAVGNFVGFANQLLQQGISAGSNFLNGVVSFISQLPSRVYSYISSTASSIISGASAWASNARSKASETVNAVISQVSQLPEKVYNEFVKIGERIRNAISGAVQAALQFGTDIKNAVLNTLGIHSPGIVQEKIATEFANIGGRIAESSVNVQNEASNFGQSIVTGMDSQMTNVQASADALTNAMNMTQADVVLDQSFVGDYQADANMIGGINQTMTSDTTLAFDTMGATVNGTINGITTNLQTSYMAMNTNQTTALTTMQNQNRTAYTNLQNQTSTSLNNMRNTTQNVTVQMIGAWNHMKDSIISSADQLKSQSTAHFNTLSSNIGSFYQKLQNPSMWGAGDYKMSAHHYSPHRGLRGANEVRRAFGVPTSGTGGRRYAGSPPSLSRVPQTMKLKDLKNLVGNSSVFNGLDMNQEVNVIEFLKANNLALGWGDWYSNHFEHIKSTSGEWDMEGPSIMHRIPTGQSFKVKEFYNSQPQISFASFQHMAEALFSAIPYEYYFNSDAHGSWVGALQAGSCNCYDGANALVALAATCGFSGHTQGGTWNGIPHVYAVINGKKMDTTGWQQRRDWNGVAAGSPPNMKVGGESKTYNVNIDMSNATFYGEDDFREKMETIAHDVLRKEVNTSITVGY